MKASPTRAGRARLARAMRALASMAGASLLACASPGERIESRALEQGLERRIIAGAPFHHLAFARTGPAARALHVYIENDGRPWQRGAQVSADPTPNEPVMLEAMASERGPALYLGRPCYFVAALDASCSALMWTHWRYSEDVVSSMEAALRTYLRERPHDRLAFLGHSGGGTLAVLLAERFAETVAVVTLAANLDVSAWTELHDYSPLVGSLDPMRRPALPRRIAQWHLVGGRDENVPARLLKGYAARHPGARVNVYPEYDHACCWQAIWPAILEQLRGLGANP